MTADERQRAIDELLDRMTGRPESFGPEVGRLLRERRARKAAEVRAGK